MKKRSKLIVFFALTLVLMIQLPSFAKKKDFATVDFYVPQNTTEQAQVLSGSAVAERIYKKDLKKDLRAAWEPELTKDSYNIGVEFYIERNGDISSVYILKPSKNPYCDNSIVETLRKMSPYNPLPKDFKGDKLKIDVMFSYRQDLSAAKVRLVKTDDYKNLYEPFNENKKVVAKKYFKDVKRSLDKALLPTKRYFDREEMNVSFTIDQNGEISDFTIEKHPESKVFEDSVKTALDPQKLVLPPLPREFGVPELTVLYKISSGVDVTATPEKPKKKKTKIGDRLFSFLCFVMLH